MSCILHRSAALPVEMTSVEIWVSMKATSRSRDAPEVFRHDSGKDED
jgi:hypothetical protein